jgi:hypothetical protein
VIDPQASALGLEPQKEVNPMATAKKKAPSRSRKARAQRVVDRFQYALSMGRSQYKRRSGNAHTRLLVANEVMDTLPPKAARALKAYVDAMREAESQERGLYPESSSWDYGMYAPAPAHLVSSVERAQADETAARKRFMQVATGKTRKARKVAKKKPSRGRK